MDAVEAMGNLTPDKDGMIRGRAADGTPIKAKIGGISAARRLRQELEKKALEESIKKKKGRRRHRRGN